MKGLIKLTETMEDVQKLHTLCLKRKVELLHKKHDFGLDDDIIAAGGLSINYGGYGSFAGIGPGKTFPNRWKMVGSTANVPNHKPLQGLTLAFAGTAWTRALEEEK